MVHFLPADVQKYYAHSDVLTLNLFSDPNSPMRIFTKQNQYYSINKCVIQKKSAIYPRTTRIAMYSNLNLTSNFQCSRIVESQKSTLANQPSPKAYKTPSQELYSIVLVSLPRTWGQSRSAAINRHEAILCPYAAPVKMIPGGAGITGV